MVNNHRQHTSAWSLPDSKHVLKRVITKQYMLTTMVASDFMGGTCFVEQECRSWEYGKQLT